MKEVFRLARVERGKGAPVLIPLLPFELGTKKIIKGKEYNIKLVPHKRQKFRIGEYVIVDEPSSWRQIGKNIYVTKAKVPNSDNLGYLLYQKELLENSNMTEDTKKLCYVLCKYMAKFSKKFHLKLPNSCFNQYWWKNILERLDIDYNVPLLSWNEKDFLKIYFLIKEKMENKNSINITIGSAN